MIGDEGSGYWIGREALAAVMRARDGRGPETQLTAAMLAHFQVDDVSRLPRIVYDREVPRMEELDLRRPIYKKTAAFGHFGRTEPEFTWERTDKAAALKAAASI